MYFVWYICLLELFIKQWCSSSHNFSGLAMCLRIFRKKILYAFMGVYIVKKCIESEDYIKVHVWKYFTWKKLRWRFQYALDSWV